MKEMYVARFDMDKFYPRTRRPPNLPEKFQKYSARNYYRLKSCRLHDFHWKEDIAKQREVKKRIDEKYGVIVNLPWPIRCRCKNCGGVISVYYAAPYMDAVDSMNRLKEGG